MSQHFWLRRISAAGLCAVISDICFSAAVSSGQSARHVWCLEGLRASWKQLLRRGWLLTTKEPALLLDLAGSSATASLRRETCSHVQNVHAVGFGHFRAAPAVQCQVVRQKNSCDNARARIGRLEPWQTGCSNVPCVALPGPAPSSVSTCGPGRGAVASCRGAQWCDCGFGCRFSGVLGRSAFEPTLYPCTWPEYDS